MASVFPPTIKTESPASVLNLTELAAIASPTIGDRIFVKDKNCDYHFVEKYITRIDANNSNAETFSYGVLPSDKTAGAWVRFESARLSNKWILAASGSSNLPSMFRAKYYGGTVKSISFEVNEPNTPNLEVVRQVYDIPDFPAVIAGTATVVGQTSVSADSGFYGGPTVFSTISGCIVAVNVKADGTVLINHIKGTLVGLIRNVKINGLPVDPVYFPDAVIPEPVVIEPAPTPTSHTVGSFDTNATTAYYVPYKKGLNITSITFDFKDRRTSYGTTRAKTGLTLNAADMPNGGNGWTFRQDNTPSRNGASQTVKMSDNASFDPLIQWRLGPSGISLYFQDSHDNTWNTYGRFENVKVNFA